MNFEDTVHFYRLTNVAYGILESMERSRSELMTLRYLQVVARRKSLGQRVIAVLLSVVALIPAIYGILPEEFGKLRLVWLTGVVVLAMGYLATVFHQWQSDKDESRELLDLLPAGAEARSDNRPEFISMLLSSYRTRWQMARIILENAADGSVKEQFTEIVAFWERRMLGLVPQLEKLVENGTISRNEYDAFTKWIPTQN